MKHAKHSGDNRKPQNEEILLCDDVYSSRNRKPTGNKLTKGKRVLDLIAKILFPIGILTLAALIIYITVAQFLPLVYILFMTAVLGVLSAVHFKLTSGK